MNSWKLASVLRDLAENLMLFGTSHFGVYITDVPTCPLGVINVSLDCDKCTNRTPVVVHQLASLIMQWGNDMCRHGAGATSTKQYKLAFDGEEISLDHLAQLPSEELHVELKELIEKETPPSKEQSRKQVDSSFYHPSNYFMEYMSSCNLISDGQPSAKRLKSS
ncbi:unnamed protein product [Trichobilharzia regenti]|nr:unnamed protein product [Trichobilharzia regenti]